MAQLTEVVLICDVHDGDSEAVGTVTFAVAGKSYEFELCEEHLAEFREVMEVWSMHARPVATQGAAGRSARSGRRDRVAGGDASPAQVREWARSQGMQVSSRGRVGAELRAAFDAAH